MLMQIVAIIRMFFLEASVQETGIFISKPHRIRCPTLQQRATTTTQSVVDCISRTVKVSRHVCLFKETVRGGCIHNSQKREPVLEWNMDRHDDRTVPHAILENARWTGQYHTQGVDKEWLLTAHIVAQYSEALRKLTENAGGTWSEQHRELYQGSDIRYQDDLQTFLVFLRSHNPFSPDDPTQLRNISTGVVADHRVNADDALTIGDKIQERVTGKRFGNVTMKKKDQAQTCSIMRKPIKVDS